MYLPKQRPVAVKKLKFHEKLTAADIQVWGGSAMRGSAVKRSGQAEIGRLRCFSWRGGGGQVQGGALGWANVTGEVGKGGSAAHS